MNKETITIVSGLPRSGTSMMMKLLEAGGMEILTDNLRTADKDNPKGYYELEVVKELQNNKAWLKDAQGKVVKVISQLLKELLPNYTYKIIFMRRNMQEILASQKQMLIRRGEPTDTISDERIAKMFQMHLVQVQTWLEKQSNMDVLFIHYNKILKKPSDYLEEINAFLGHSLDVARMAGAIDRSLHRQRSNS
ncbi:MAG: sulfotransferase domain-containing protein [bacterium]